MVRVTKRIKRFQPTEGKTWQKRWTDRKSQSVLLNKNEACVHIRLFVHLKIVKVSFPGWDADWLSCYTCKSRQHRSISDVHCAPYTGFLKCRISSACPWLWFPCLGSVQQFQAFPIQSHLSGSSDDQRSAAGPSNINLESHLRSKENKLLKLCTEGAWVEFEQHLGRSHKE